MGIPEPTPADLERDAAADLLELDHHRSLLQDLEIARLCEDALPAWISRYYAECQARLVAEELLAGTRDACELVVGRMKAGRDRLRAALEAAEKASRDYAVRREYGELQAKADRLRREALGLEGGSR